jgi:hypothetical protein
MLFSIYTLLFLTAVILLAVSGYYYNDTLQLLKDGVNTQAIVSNILEESDGDGTTYRPVFTFTCDDGQEVTFYNPVASNPCVWERGESVSVIYDRYIPTNAKVVSYWGLFRTTIICLMIATPLLVVSTGYLMFQVFLHSYRLVQ